MKILHTADWHLGHRLHEQSQFEEQQLFLDWLTQHIVSEKYDVLLISGDVFDTGMPSNQSLEQYYNFLIGLNGTCCKDIIITGGNHDSPSTLNAPKEILKALNIKVVGKATEELKEELFQISTEREAVWIAAVPYLRDQDVRRAVSGESFEDANDRYKAALIKHYDGLAEICKEKNAANHPVIAMGHLFALGGSISDSEKEISVGNLGHIGADDFNMYFDYVALGHLHRPQIVGEKEHIRYTGSPVILSFSEVGYDKKIVAIDIENNQISKFEEHTIPCFRNVIKISGTIDVCLEKLETVSSNEFNLQPWVEVIINNDEAIVDIKSIKDKAELLGVHVVKISLKNKIVTKGFDEIMEDMKEIKTLQPSEIFEKKCEEMNFDLSENKEISEAFHEIIQAIQEKE